MTDTPALLLLGGTGFVGGYLAPALAAAYPGHRRVLLTRAGDEAVPHGWEARTADLLNPGMIEDLVAEIRPEVVVHLAAVASVMSDAETTWGVNFGGTFALASAVARHAPEGVFLFSSSGEVYGRSFKEGVATEETVPRPQNPYASSKLAAEGMLRDVLPATKRLVVTRSFNHTGPGQDERFVLPTFAAQIARMEAGQTPPVMHVGNLSAERDFLHVADVVDAYVRLLTTPGLESRVLVNVASGHAYRIDGLLERLRSASRCAFEVEIDPARLRPSDIPRAVGDPSSLKRMIGWEPKRNIEEILLELLAWWRMRLSGSVPHSELT